METGTLLATEIKEGIYAGMSSICRVNSNSYLGKPLASSGVAVVGVTAVTYTEV